MPLFDTDGIVLRNYNFDEADKIVSLFTKDKGKIKVVARGVRKTKSTLAAGLQPFTHSHIVVYQGKSDLGKLSQCEINQSFARVHKDINKVAYASYIVEVVDEFTPMYEQNSLIFALLLLTMRLLNQIEDVELVSRIFELKLLKILGYQPYLAACVECGNKLDQRIRFDAEAGGVVCSCSSNWSKKISLGTVKYMDQMLRMDYQKIIKMSLPDYARKELSKIMPYYIQSLIKKKLKSISFINTLEEIN